MAVTPTALDTDLRAMAQQLIGTLGRTLLLRRPVRQEIKTGANIGTVATSPLSASALLLNGAALAGAAAIGLRAAGLVGLLVANDSLLIGGASYRVTGGPYQPDGTGAIAGISITPALAAPASDGDAVAVTFSGTEYRIKGAVSGFSLFLINSSDSQIESGDFKVAIAQADLDALGIQPTTKDELYNGPDKTYPRCAILNVTSIASGEQDAAVELHARAAK
jgi:hypothetical protein